MYQRALRGFEKALSKENILTYVLALNTLKGFGYLYKHQANIAKAKTIRTLNSIMWV